MIVVDLETLFPSPTNLVDYQTICTHQRQRHIRPDTAPGDYDACEAHEALGTGERQGKNAGPVIVTP